MVLSREERLAMMQKDLFREDPYEDPRSRRRTVPMQVLNLSFLRTGTMSMQAALNELGYNCYHSVIFFSAIRDTDMWREALNAKYNGQGKPFTRQDWDQLLGHYSAVSADTPAIVFAKELIEAYPEAKVVLVERDIDKWFASYDKGIIAAQHSFWNHFVADLNPSYVGAIRDVNCNLSMLNYVKASTKEEHRANAKAVYRAHYDLVRSITPKERLLEFKLEDGWDPLCEFLGKEKPETPFPRVNDAEALHDMIGMLLKKGLVRQAKMWVIYIVPILVLGLAWFLYR